MASVASICFTHNLTHRLPHFTSIQRSVQVRPILDGGAVNGGDDVAKNQAAVGISGGPSQALRSSTVGGRGEGGRGHGVEVKG